MKNIFNLILLFGIVFSVDYQSEIQPIFDENCGNCHLGNSSGGLNLSSYENLMNGSSNGAVVIPGDHASSVLYERITRHNDDPGDMPPGNAELNESMKQMIADWIDEGALPEESSDISGCTDFNAISCNDEIDSLYFPECETCSDDDPCENYYNPDATIDNGLCMYNDVPSYEEFSIHLIDSGFEMNWSLFIPPVDITQYVMQRCVDFDGDSDGDGVLEYDVCNMIITPGSFFLDSNFIDEYELDEDSFLKYTLYVHYPNNNYWGSAQGYYYYETEQCVVGDVSEDGIINVIDIVNLVNYILGSNEFTDSQLCAADLNGDSIINVIDIVNLVNAILN